MSKWLEAETAGFNRTFARRQVGTPLVEFLTVAARRAAGIYGRALHDVTTQVPIPPSSSAAAERWRPLYGRANVSRSSMHLCMLEIWKCEKYGRGLQKSPSLLPLLVLTAPGQALFF